MKIRLFLFCCFSLCGLHRAAAQFHQPLYTDLAGQELYEAVRDYFTPGSTPASDFARDVLYADIYNVNGFVSCVYTGFTIDLPPGDPSQEAFALGINAEHTMPRSYLEGTGHEFDLHNLYPTRTEVNSDRSNFPFTDINDTQTDTWYYLDTQQSSIPSNNIDLYSEQVNGFFEPREDHKGNAARAMFYTYLVYGHIIEQNAPQYFEQQRQNLCAWHVSDPADQAEYDRTYLIGTYQNDKPNPFVLDCTLASRIFCQDTDIECTPPMISGTEEGINAPTLTVKAENPFFHRTNIEVALTEAAHLRLTVYDATGKIAARLTDDYREKGVYYVDFQSNIGNALFFVTAEAITEKGTHRQNLQLLNFGD